MSSSQDQKYTHFGGFSVLTELVDSFNAMQDHAERWNNSISIEFSEDFNELFDNLNPMEEYYAVEQWNIIYPEVECHQNYQKTLQL